VSPEIEEALQNDDFLKTVEKNIVSSDTNVILSSLRFIQILTPITTIIGNLVSDNKLPILVSYLQNDNDDIRGNSATVLSSVSQRGYHQQLIESGLLNGVKTMLSSYNEDIVVSGLELLRSLCNEDDIVNVIAKEFSLNIFFDLLKSDDEDKSNAGAYFISRVSDVIENSDYSEVMELLLAKAQGEFFSSLTGLEAILSCAKYEQSKEKIIQVGGINVLNEIIGSTSKVDIPRKISAYLIRFLLSSKVPFSDIELEILSSFCSQIDEDTIEILEESPIRIHYSNIHALSKSNGVFQKFSLWNYAFCSVLGDEKIRDEMAQLYARLKGTLPQNFQDMIESKLDK